MKTPDCTACLGTRQCWVCLGSGLLEQPGHRESLPCHRCRGTAACPVCRPEKVAAAEPQAPVTPDAAEGRRLLRLARRRSTQAKPAAA